LLKVTKLGIDYLEEKEQYDKRNCAKARKSA
jgi:hypothetical protein